MSDANNIDDLQTASVPDFRTFTEQSPNMIFINMGGQVVYANKKCEDILGYTREEFLAPDFDFMSLIAPESLDLVKANFGRHMNGEELNPYEYGLIKKDGQKIDAIITSRLISFEGQNAILGIVTDITHLKRAEKELKKSEKNSLARQNMEQVLKAGHRAKDLVKQILAFSRKSEQDKKIILITPIIKEVLMPLRASLPTTIEIRQHIEPSLGAIFADPTQIHQVMMNLCTNSAHAVENTGGTLEVRVLNVTLELERAPQFQDLSPGQYVALIVKDSGHGMDSATPERIFNPYFTTKTKDKGTGMGLAVVHGIVKGHNGGIHVTSSPGEGTTVEILFPRTASIMQYDTEELNALPGGNEQILFVDDEETLIDFGESMLVKLGYRVSTRTSPIEAIEAFKANPHRFDLVISDMTMPNMTGDIPAKALLKIRADIPIIICTGFSEQISEQNTDQIDIRGFLMKPLTIRELARTVRRVLDES